MGTLRNEQNPPPECGSRGRHGSLRKAQYFNPDLGAAPEKPSPQRRGPCTKGRQMILGLMKENHAGTESLQDLRKITSELGLKGSASSMPTFYSSESNGPSAEPSGL